MEDLIYKQAAINALKKVHEEIWLVDIPSPGECPEYREHHEQMQMLMKKTKKLMEEIEAMPSERQEIIYCKECKHAYEDKYYGDYWCNRTFNVIKVTANDFCSKGKNK